MTPAERRRIELIGPEANAALADRVAATPEPEPGDWVDLLRRIFATPQVALSEVSLPSKAA